MNKYKTTIISILVVLVILIGGYWLYSAMMTRNGGQVNNQEQQSYTLEVIARHATSTDCWMAIGGKVYDVTPMITANRHPGGAAILLGCGKDATVLFNTRPMGSKTPHSDNARALLPQFFKGNLASR